MKLNRMKKAISIFLTVIMVIGMMPVVRMDAGAAEDGIVLYLKPNSNWMQADARFAAYSWGESSNGWADFVDNGDGYYKVEIPSDRTGIIFLRMNPDIPDNNFDSGEGKPLWNRIGNLTITAENNCFTMNEGVWSNDTTEDTTSGTWSCKHLNNGEGVCSVCGSYVDGIGAKLAGYTLSLSGNIGVNFHMELADSVLADEDAYMKFTLPNKAEPTIIKVADVKDNPVSIYYGEEEKYYVFPCEVAAKEMSQEIKAQMFANGKEGEVYTYSVQEYAEAILNCPVNYTYSPEEEDPLIELVKAMLEYGSYSQKYFNENTEKLADENLESLLSDFNDPYDPEAKVYAVTDLSKTTIADLEKYKHTTVGTLSEIGSATVSLELESETALNVYFKPNPGVENIAITLDGNAYAVEPLTDGTYVINITDIQASELDKVHTFAISGSVGGELKTWTVSNYSALSYCYVALANASDKEVLVNVAKALYLYNVAADDYFAKKVQV